MMTVQYNIVVSIVNLIDNSISKFSKIFSDEITATDALLYNNYHVLSKGVYVIDMFEAEVDAYCKSMGIQKSSVEVDEFEIVSLTDRTDIFFESENPNDNSLSLKPIIKCYVYPKNDALEKPTLNGIAYDSTTIIWTWPEDEIFAHYLVEEAIDPDNESDTSKIIAQLPIGVSSYTETGLEADTSYTRRLISYTDEQTSVPSAAVTVITNTVNVEQSLEEYSIPKNYDFTTDDSERNIIDENLEAFHSGIGCGNDLKVYKQMDADFYQKFKAYFEISGKRTQREKRYEQVGFNYKLCLEATEEIEEQEGEVTFDIEAYPREWVSLEDYMWATVPVAVKIRFQATVFLRKEEEKKEEEELVIWKPKIEMVTPPPTVKVKYDPLNLVIVWDVTLSMFYTAGGWRETTDSGNKADNNINAAVNALSEVVNNVSSKGNIAIKFITFDNSATCHGGYDAGVITADDCNANKHYKMTKTNWVAALAEATAQATALKTANPGGYTICLFFSDGSHNAGGTVSGAGIKGVCDQVIPIIANVTSSHGINYTTVNGTTNGIAISDGMGNAREIVKNSDIISWGDSASLTAKINEAQSQMIETIENPPYPVFNGWEEQPEKIEHVEKYDIDHIKAVTIQSDVYTFTFDKNNTPPRYERKEKRAIVPETSFLVGEKVTTTNLYDLIMDKVKQTGAWKAGYDKTIGTVELNGEEDKFLIKGLFIQDTYNFADEDEITEPNWGDSTWEDGMEGSVNAYTDIDKAGTTTYGDDCYLVSKDNYLMIQGYTDAILYDGTRFPTAELNAYDHNSEILISASAVYNGLLYNRKKKSLTYAAAGGTDKLQHVVDVAQKDKDIWFEGYPGLANAKVGDWLEIGELTSDLIAHNDIWFESPVLNYRFNLEDPDAKTSIYEILPTCDPDSNYLHIVILHVYYANNVWITDKNNFVPTFGDGPLAEKYTTPFIPLIENIYKWTLKEWKDGTGKDNGWYIDNYIWFMAAPMLKIQDYYDELPGAGMETFYGLVNGRYRSDNQSGKKDLTVDSPQFNIPTTVIAKHKDSIRIYATITEFYPDTALVSYRWEHPWNNKDGITQVNGDYIYFSSDNLTYKDIDYIDVITTINMENQEVFDNKTAETRYEIQKPNTVYEYTNFYLEVTTDNSDVLALRYPTEISFDENGIANIGVNFKGVVNATSKWAPRIHNGYYYLNQHEFFAYSEFDVDADFDTYEETNFKTINGYISIDVQLRRIADPEKFYSITKDTRSELLQNEKQFQWIDEKGLTLKPVIDGEYYREYNTFTYHSPIILFENTLTTAGKLKVDYYFEDGSDYLPMQIRAYDVEAGAWTPWMEFMNNTVPTVLSCAYQVRFDLQSSVQNTDKFIEDYLCCYLDWKDDQSEANLTNIVTITDHMTTGPDNAEGIYISRIFDFGCETELMLDLFESAYKNHVQLYLGYSNDDTTLLLENIHWNSITSAKNTGFKARYFRYKMVIPAGEKVYWLHKRLTTKETHELLPYVTGISMTGSYAPEDIVTNFINIESFSMPKDGEYHVVFNGLMDLIGADVLAKGFKESEIENVSVLCTTPDIQIKYDKNIENHYPGDALNSSIQAMAEIDKEIIIKNTPYIFVHQDEEYRDVIEITGTPQQYCPITVEDTDGNSFIQLHNTKSFILEESFNLTKETKYVEVGSNRYDPNNFHVYLNNEELDISLFKVVNHLVIFEDFIPAWNTIKLEYCILYSFIADIDRINNKTILYLHTGEGLKITEKYKVYFETGTKNNKFIADQLSLNPIYRTDYKGFIYLTDEHNDAYRLKIYCNPMTLKAGGYDKVDISVEVLDIHDNPIIAKDVAIDCDFGILNCESYVTDMNGVIHLVYESAYKKCTDILTAKVVKDDGTLLKESISIINE